MRLFLNQQEEERLNKFDRLFAENEVNKKKAMRNRANEEELALFYVLILGCRRHRYHFCSDDAPFAGCSKCSIIEKTGQELIDRGYDLFKGRKPRKKTK